MSNQEEYTIDLAKIANVIRKNAIMFLLIITVCGACAFFGSKYMIPKTYSATASVVIVSNDETNQGITYNDVQLSQKLVTTYSRILRSEAVGERVLANLTLTGNGWTPEDYKEAIDVRSDANTEVLDIVVTTQDPELSARIANETVKVFGDQVYKIMNVRNVTILDRAKVPLQPSGPNMKRNTVLGLAIGFILSVLIAFLKSMQDTKIKSEEEVKELLNYPVIGIIPDIGKSGRSVTSYAGKQR